MNLSRRVIFLLSFSHQLPLWGSKAPKLNIEKTKMMMEMTMMVVIMSSTTVVMLTTTVTMTKTMAPKLNTKIMSAVVVAASGVCYPP